MILSNLKFENGLSGTDTGAAFERVTRVNTSMLFSTRTVGIRLAGKREYTLGRSRSILGHQTKIMWLFQDGGKVSITFLNFYSVQLQFFFNNMLLMAARLLISGYVSTSVSVSVSSTSWGRTALAIVVARLLTAWDQLLLCFWGAAKQCEPM